MSRDRTLWAGVLLPPAAWAISLCVNYFLSSVACDGAWPLSLHVVTVVSLGIVVAGGVLAWRVRTDDATDGSGREQFMAIGGLALAAIFAFTILAQWWPAFWIEPCRV